MCIYIYTYLYIYIYFVITFSPIVFSEVARTVDRPQMATRHWREVVGLIPFPTFTLDVPFCVRSLGGWKKQIHLRPKSSEFLGQAKWREIMKLSFSDHSANSKNGKEMMEWYVWAKSPMAVVEFRFFASKLRHISGRWFNWKGLGCAFSPLKFDSEWKPKKEGLEDDPPFLLGWKVTFQGLC